MCPFTAQMTRMQEKREEEKMVTFETAESTSLNENRAKLKTQNNKSKN